MPFAPFWVCDHVLVSLCVCVRVYVCMCVLHVRVCVLCVRVCALPVCVCAPVLECAFLCVTVVCLKCQTVSARAITLHQLQHCLFAALCL